MDHERKNYRVVYTIIERNQRKIWVRIGAAFSNRDGSVNVLLDAMPTNGRLQIRDWVPADERPRSVPRSFEVSPPEAMAS